MIDFSTNENNLVVNNDKKIEINLNKIIKGDQGFVWLLYLTILGSIEVFILCCNPYFLY